MQLPELRAGVGAEFFGEPFPGALVVRERVGRAAAPVEGEQVLDRQALV